MQRQGCFSAPMGVEQDDVVKPALFAISINNYVQVIKRLECGVRRGDEMVNVPLYAEDFV